MKIDWPVERFCEMYELRTEKQKQLLQLLMEGMKDPEIIELLNIDQPSANFNFIFKKTNFSNRNTLMSEIYKIAMEGK